MGAIAVTGSVANDTIMHFDGRFGDHILPEHTNSINVSFQVDVLDVRRGGTAANICYTLALLGERPLLCGAVGGADFDEYAALLRDAGVDVTHALRCDGVSTAAGFITTDRDGNQITAFHAGAMSRANDVDLLRLEGVSDVVVGADASDAMALHSSQARELGARLVFVPAQQIPAMSDEQLRTGLDAAWLVGGNAYEMHMIEERTGRSVQALARERIVVVTHGAAGSEVHSHDTVEQIPSAPVAAVVDPTGAGDAYVAGLVHGVRSGVPLPVAARMGALAAAWCVEHVGPQGHRFTRAEFDARYAAAFGTPPSPLGGGVE